MDSSIKKCSGYLKKLKLLSEHPSDSLLKELDGVNLQKYVIEVVSCMLELKFTKSVDLMKAVQVCAVMQQRHGAEFTPALISGLAKVFEGTKTTWKRAQQERQNIAAQALSQGQVPPQQTPAEQEEEKAQIARKRSTMRFMTELYLSGVSTDLKPLLGVLSELLASDTRNEPDHSNTIVQLLNSWLKYAGESILGLSSRQLVAANKDAGLPAAPEHPEYLSAAQREQLMQKLFLPYGKQMHERLVGVHTALQKLEKRVARMQMMRGEIPLDMSEERKRLREQMSALQAQVETYFDYLDLTLEPLPEIADAEDELLSLVSLASSDASALEGDANLGPWDDVETKNFYESLIDLRVVVPPVLLQEGNEKEKARIRREKDAASAGEEEAAAEAETEVAASETAEKDRRRRVMEDDSYLGNWNMTIEELEARVAALHSSKERRAAAGGGAGAQGDEYVDSIYEVDEDGNPVIPERFVGKEKRSHPMELLLQSISHSLNREAIDVIAEKFCYLNTKNNRMRLVEAVYTLPRTRVDEIPYWCRLLATLHQHMKSDLVEELIHLFTSEFYRLLRGKNQFRIESKIRNIRFLTEFVKFQLAPATLLFKCWHALLLSFTPNAIQLICLILENCGRWLYRTPQSHMRCAQFLERTMQLKETRYLDKNLNLLLENAYFSVRPPPPSPMLLAPKKVRSIMHQFIRKSVFEELNPKTTEAIIRRLRKLNWNEKENLSDPSHESARTLVVKCLSNVSNVAFGNLTSLAMLCAGLNRYHHTVGVGVTDNLLEEVRVGLDLNRFSQNQRRLLNMEYLGRLFLLKVVEAHTIFDTLYLLLTLGHEVDDTGKLTSKIDPPGDTFRIRLVVALLEVCGTSFDQGILKKRLDRFLLYFERYLFLKELIPIDLQFALADLLEKLRPNYQRAASMADVSKQIAAMEAESTHATVDRLHSLTAAAETGASTPRSQLSDVEGEDVEEEEGEGDEGDEAEGGESYADKATKGNNALLDAAMNALEGEGSDDDSDESDEDESSSDEEDAFDRKAAAPTRSKEEIAFQLEYDKMMADSMESAKFLPRNSSSMGSVQVVTAAAGLKEPSSRNAQEKQSFAVIDGEEQAAFRFLSRNAKKQTTQARTLYIPADADMVSSTYAQRIEAEKEKEEAKRLLLKGLQRTEREAMEEERLTREEKIRQERAEGVRQDFSHRSVQPAAGRDSLARVGAVMGGRQKKEDLSLKLDSFAFASEETLTSSRVTLQSRPSQYQGKK